MERITVHRDVISKPPGKMQYDEPALYLNGRKPGYGWVGLFKRAGQKLTFRGKSKGLIIYGPDDIPLRQKIKNLKRLYNSHNSCIDKNDPYGYYFIKFIEIQSQNLHFMLNKHKQVVCLKLIDSMKSYQIGSSSSKVCNLPVVFRGGGYAGRAGLIAHGLRFPRVI